MNIGSLIPARRWLNSVWVIAVLSQGVAFAEESVLVEFDIDAQELGDALTEFGVQSGTEVYFVSADVAGLQAPRIEGKYSAIDVIHRLLGSSGVKYLIDGNGTLLVGTAYTAVNTSDQRGASDSKNLETVTPILMAQNQTSQQTTSSRNEDDVQAQEDEPPVPLEEIIVIGTGTNIRGVENPTVPVLTFDREDIDLSGAATVDDFLRTIPQNFASETQLSANSGNPFDSGRNRTQGTSVDLRGLGAGSTLTLLNGRRMAASGETSNVDINVLPLGIIERVDLLTDGATAVYGSDAVGGVINFVTRKDFEGFDINARYGTVTEGSKEDFGVGAAGGFSWESGGLFAGVDYQETKPLLVSERDFVDLNITPQPDASFGSDTERFSVAGGVSQDLSSNARVGLDVLFTDSQSEAADLGNSSTVSFNEQDALFINSRFEYDINERITAALYFDYGQNRADRTVLDFQSSAALTGQQFDNDLRVYEAQLSGELFNITGGAVSFSIGGLYREEDFKASVLAGSTPAIEGNRNIKAGYGELLVPIIGGENRSSVAQKLELSLAGRFEDYSDFGDTLDPKIGVYWEVNDELSFRTSYAESFRAPDLFSINSEQIFSVSVFPAAFFTAIAPEEIVFDTPFPAYIFLRPSGGNPDLEPEFAETLSAGFTYEPSFIDGLTIQGNYFTIDYSNRLESPGILLPIQDPNFTQLVDIPPDPSEVQSIFDRAAAGEATLLNFFNFSPSDVQVLYAPSFVNIAEREVSGFDLNLGYAVDTELGEFALGANASYLIDYIGRAIEGAPASEQVNTLYRPMHFRMRGNLSWAKDGLTAFAAVNYTNDYRDNPDRSVANDIDDWTTVDLSLVYNTEEHFDNPLLDGVRLGFNVTNLFDGDPPFVSTPFGLNYDSANANPFGRQINFTVSKTF